MVLAPVDVIKDLVVRMGGGGGGSRRPFDLGCGGALELIIIELEFNGLVKVVSLGADLTGDGEFGKDTIVRFVCSGCKGSGGGAGMLLLVMPDNSGEAGGDVVGGEGGGDLGGEGGWAGVNQGGSGGGLGGRLLFGARGLFASYVIRGATRTE